MKPHSLVLASALAIALSGFAQAKVLNVGDKAPALKLAKWVKGKETKAFKPGQVYVVEFWATWCGPCKESIPHISKMAATFKDKATFIGVDVWEDRDAKDTSYFKKVEDFVSVMGDRMAYNVAIDGPDGFMAKNWLQAAEENGIPSAFIVDKTGTIAWIGHPMAGMEEALTQIVDGTWDAKSFAVERAAQKEVEAAQMDIMRLAQQGKIAEALTALEKFEAEYPQYAGMMAGMKFDLMLEQNEDKAYAYARSFLQEATEQDAGVLNSMAWGIVDRSTGLKKPDYKLALDLAKKASEFTGDSDPSILDTLALAYFKSGDKASAIRTQEKAIRILKSENGPAEMIREFEDRLEMFKKG